MAFTPEPRIKTALDNTKLRLSAPTPGVQGKFGSLQWQLIANNPRIVVYTNDPNDTGESKGYGKINANLDLPTFYAFLAKLYEVIDSKEEVKYKIENMNYTWFGGKRSETPQVQSELHFGKDKDGLVWISVTAKDRPRIKFTFAPTNFHHFVRGDGTPLTAAETSVIFAKAYVHLLENLFATMADSKWTEPPPRDDKGGGRGGFQKSGGGGNYNRGGSSGGGGSNVPVEEDIPF